MQKQKVDAVNQLRDYDHCLISPDGVAHFAKAFGVKLVPTMHKASPREPKGLTLLGDAKEALGMEADILARKVCDKLGVKYRYMMGRGFQLRECCNQLHAHFMGADNATD